MRPLLQLTLPAALMALSCASAPEPEPVQDDSPAALARAALERGDWAVARELAQGLQVESDLARARAELNVGRAEEAWEILEGVLKLEPRNSDARVLRREIAEVIVPPELERARTLLLEGNPRDAMLPLDDIVRVVPDDAEVLFLRGECAMRMGVEDGNPILFEDAKRAFLAAAKGGRVPEAWLGAARASWMTFYQSGEARDLTRALEYAQEGMARIGEDPALAPYLSVPPDRTNAEIHFAGYTAALNGALPRGRAPELFEATRLALEEVVGVSPTDPWAWNQLANLYQWEGRLEDARAAALRGLGISPADSSLHDSLVRVVSQIGGWDEVLAVYEEFVGDHPDLALGQWHLARAKYERALAGYLDQNADEREGFREAEETFRHCRELEPEYESACLGYEVICRDGYGWCLFKAGELDEAADAWRSMEELFPGGMRWEVQGKLWSGVNSLAYLIGVLNERWLQLVRETIDTEDGLAVETVESEIPKEERFPNLVKATALANELYAYDPEDPNFANNAGFFNRDLGVEYEVQAAEILREADGDRAHAEELLKLAVDHLELSFAAYVKAAELAPDDARVVNDTGLILAYYLQRDLDTARQYFQDAIDVGLPQLEAGIEDEEDRTMTRESVGDAYQNLGVVALTLDGDAAAAKPLFEQSLGYERDPRVMVNQYYIPICDKILAGELDPQVVRRAHYWSELELDRVLDRLAALTELYTAFRQE